MKIPEPSQILSVVMIVGIGGVGYLAWKAKKNADKVIDKAELIITENVNPSSRKNIIFSNSPDFVKNGGLDFIFKGLGL